MTAPVFHRHNAYGPVCGVRDGCSAKDFDPPEVTCKRCRRIPPTVWEREHYVYRDGSIFLAEGVPA